MLILAPDVLTVQLLTGNFVHDLFRTTLVWGYSEHPWRTAETPVPVISPEDAPVVTGRERKRDSRRTD